jgi:hypothetical protein
MWFVTVEPGSAVVLVWKSAVTLNDSPGFSFVTWHEKVVVGAAGLTAGHVIPVVLM